MSESNLSKVASLLGTKIHQQLCSSVGICGPSIKDVFSDRPDRRFFLFQDQFDITSRPDSEIPNLIIQGISEKIRSKCGDSRFEENIQGRLKN